MAIRAVIGWEDLVKPPVTNGSVKLGGTPFTSVTSSAAAGTNIDTKYEDGWLKRISDFDLVASGTQTRANGLNALLSDLGLVVTTATSKFTIGIRFLNGTPGSTTAIDIYSEPLSITPYALPTTAQLTTGCAFPAGSIPNYTSKQEYYLEAQWDVAAGVIHRWVDGVAIADIAITSTTLTALKAGTACYLNIGRAPSSTGVKGDFSYWIKDIYVCETTSDGTANGPLGSQRVLVAPVVSMDQSTWVVTPAGNVVSALNTVITDAASLSTPIVTSDPANPTANLGFVAPVFVGTINAVAYNLTARRKDGSTANLSAQVVSGANQSAVSSLTVSDVMASGTSLLVAGNAPDGTAWTKAKLDAAKLKLITG